MTDLDDSHVTTSSLDDSHATVSLPKDKDHTITFFVEHGKRTLNPMLFVFLPEVVAHIILGEYLGDGEIEDWGHQMIGQIAAGYEPIVSDGKYLKVMMDVMFSTVNSYRKCMDLFKGLHTSLQLRMWTKKPLLKKWLKVSSHNAKAFDKATTCKKYLQKMEIIDSLHAKKPNERRPDELKQPTKPTNRYYFSELNGEMIKLSPSPVWIECFQAHLMPGTRAHDCAVKYERALHWDGWGGFCGWDGTGGWDEKTRRPIKHACDRSAKWLMYKNKFIVLAHLNST